MVEKITTDDAELLRRATDAFGQGQAILNFTGQYLRDKYSLSDNDKVMPNGEIYRVNLEVDDTLSESRIAEYSNGVSGG